MLNSVVCLFFKYFSYRLIDIVTSSYDFTNKICNKRIIALMCVLSIFRYTKNLTTNPKCNSMLKDTVCNYDLVLYSL